MSSKGLQDRLADVSGSLTNLKKAVSVGEDRYLRWCSENNENPHQSPVHSFKDTVQQAYVLSVPADTERKAENLAEFTFFVHLIDDHLDSDKDFTRKFGECFDYSSFYKNASPDVKAIANKMTNIGGTKQEKEAAERTIMKFVHGALVQQAPTIEKQKKQAERFKEFIIEPIKDSEIRRDLSKIHPMLLYLTTHTAADGWFAMEGNKENPLLDEMYSVFYAPLVYQHDYKKEAEIQEGKVRYGKNLLTPKGFISDDNLISMLEVFDKHITRIPDKFQDKHFQQMQAIYHSFAPALTPTLRKRYEKSLERFGEYVNQNKQGNPNNRIANGKNIEGILSFTGLLGLMLIAFTNPSLLGNVIGISLSSSNWSFIDTAGLIIIFGSLILLLRLRYKSKRFRNSFHK